ncbi:MAG: uncharacterized protein A8A55_3232 [Amphiamblys sp. WSBS2006]|nr:MAG: uncharacterized protein A8A55_3232 [Amphiamblys sp. WSBS2006]
MCREMHFVLCRECLEYLKRRTDKREVVCPYCKEKKSDKAYQKEILGVLFSLMSHKTLHSLELRPDTEVKTVTRLARETKVVLSNITIAASLFFELLAKTAVEVQNRVSLAENDDSLGWCIGELGWETGGRTKISVYGCSEYARIQRRRRIEHSALGRYGEMKRMSVISLDAGLVLLETTDTIFLWSYQTKTPQKKYSGRETAASGSGR